MNKPRIFQLGENALTIDFGNHIAIEINERVLSLAEYFENNKFIGYIESVPAYSSLTVFYDVYKIRKTQRIFNTAFDFVYAEIEKAFSEIEVKINGSARLLKIPICFDAEFAFDLSALATERRLSIQKTIEIFLSPTYRVFMLGFLPGFSYMGEINEKIATPRKPAPRQFVPAGSVGIAGKQTGIYSLDSPGGWQIIGRTPLEMFNPEIEHPIFLQPGDSIRFYEIDKNDFHSIQQKN